MCRATVRRDDRTTQSQRWSHFVWSLVIDALIGVGIAFFTSGDWLTILASTTLAALVVIFCFAGGEI